MISEIWGWEKRLFIQRLRFTQVFFDDTAHPACGKDAGSFPLAAVPFARVIKLVVTALKSGTTEMKPIQDLLHRIQWDQDFADAEFEIGYYDRVEDRIVLVPFAALHLPKGAPFVFELYDPDGGVRQVPFHRVREVYRNGRCIWKRPDPDK